MPSTTRGGARKLAITEWGPSFWHTLHTVAWTTHAIEEPTPEQRRDAHAFVAAFARVIPCPECREHFQDLARDDLAAGTEAPAFASRGAFAARTVEWHNAVNRRLGKPERSLESVRRDYFEGDPRQARGRGGGVLAGGGAGALLLAMAVGASVALAASVTLRNAAEQRARRTDDDAKERSA